MGYTKALNIGHKQTTALLGKERIITGESGGAGGGGGGQKPVEATPDFTD